MAFFFFTHSCQDIWRGKKKIYLIEKLNLIHFWRMSEAEEHGFIREYLTWMKGSLIQFESLHIYNFGYQRNLPLPSIALSPDSKLKFNLQRSGMQTPSRRSIVIIGDGYLGRYQEIMTIVDRIQEDSQALPFAIFVQTEEEVKLENISSHMMPAALVGKYIKHIKKNSAEWR